MESPIDATYSESHLALTQNPSSSPIAMPVVSNEQAQEAMDAYLGLCRAVLKDDDYQGFRQWDGKKKKYVDKQFLKKSGVKKLQTFFGISVRIRETIMDQMPDGHFGFRVTATATKKNGDSTDATGACSTLEERFSPEMKDDESKAAFEARARKVRSRAYHDVLSTAECVPLRAEILTKRGFLKYDEVTVGEDVLAYDALTDTTKWVPLQEVSTFDSARLVHIENQGFRTTCTPDHKWAVRYRLGRKKIPAQKLAKWNEMRGNTGLCIVLAAPCDQGGTLPLLPEEAAILGWLVTDGNIQFSKIGGKNGPYMRGYIEQAKPLYVKELHELLAGKVSVATTPIRSRTFPTGKAYDTQESTRFSLKSEVLRALFDKACILEPEELISVATRISPEARAAMLDAMLKGDGGRHGNTWVFHQAKTWVSELFQVLATLQGFALGIPHYKNVPTGYLTCFSQTVRVNRFALVSSMRETEIKQSEPVWCPTTEYGTWVMRLDGQPMITGNTRASNRAIMNAIGVGGGEVTAEEMPAPTAPASASSASKARPKVEAPDEHTKNLRYALSAHVACFPEIPNNERRDHIMGFIKGHFDLQEAPKTGADCSEEQLKWAGDYFTKLKIEHESVPANGGKSPTRGEI